MAKEQIANLERKLEEAEKARDQAEQDGYEVGVNKTEEALRAEVVGVCKTYCLQVWNEALNQARVEAFSALRRAVHLLPLSNPCAQPPKLFRPSNCHYSKKVDEGKGSPTKISPSSSSPSKVEEQAKATEKEKESSKGVVLENTKPLVAPKDPSKGKESSKDLEIILATLPLPAKEDPKGKGPTSTTTEVIKPSKGTESN